MSKQVVFNSGPGYWVKLFLPFAITIAAFIPAMVLLLTGNHQDNPIQGLVLFGVAIVAAAFMLGWIGEAAELDLSGGLAVSILALVTILPEYVIEFYFSWAAGADPKMIEYATANLTGANRIVQGFGWPVVALIAFFLVRKARTLRSEKRVPFEIKLEVDTRADLGYLLIASVLMLIVPLTSQMHLVVGILLIAIYCIYLWRVSGSSREEPELEGTAAHVGALPTWARRTFILLMLTISATVIFVSAHPFGDSLIEGGHALKIDEYILVQWLAPIASEAPEFALAFIFAAKGKQAAALAILISSKLNQWTLLAGSMPIAYMIGGGENAALPVVGRSAEEMWLTSAMTLLGVALLLKLRWGFIASIITLGLFLLSVVPDENFRIYLGVAHLVVAIGYFWHYRDQIVPTLRATAKRVRE